MPIAINLTGKIFGRLLVLGKSPNKNRFGKIVWECLCDPKLNGCGNKTFATTSHLNSGATRSCGCFAIETTKETNTKHGYTKYPEYKVWNTMKDRCYKETHKNYPRYGGRGIKMSLEWRNSFEAFYSDMGPRPDDTYTIERRNNNGNYCKENCHWATRTAQANNRRSNIFYEYDRESKTLPDWCRDLGLNYTAVEQRIRVLKMPFEVAITYKSVNGKNVYTINGKTQTLAEWCREYGRPIPVTAKRLVYGWSIEDALSSIEHKVIEVDGSTNTLEHWCELFDLNKDVVYPEVLRGKSFIDIVKNQ